MPRRGSRRGAQSDTVEVSLQIITSAITGGELPDAQQEANRYRRSDIFTTYNTRTIATLDEHSDWRLIEPFASPRTGFVHMRNVPVERARNIRRQLSCWLTEINLADYEDTREERALARRRRWRFKIDDMPGPRKNELLNEGETSMAWTSARTLIFRKSMTDPYDPTADDEYVLEDEDLPDTV